MPARDGPGPAARGLIVALYATVFCLLLPVALWQAGTAIDAVLRWERQPSVLGVPLLVAGAALVLWGMATLWRGGGGLPIGALAPPRLTRQGPYRLVRHPIYLGFNVALFGAGLAAGSRGVAWVITPLFAPTWVLYALLEERGLTRRFGGEYRRYRRQVKLLPRLGLYRFAQLLQIVGLFPARAAGREHVPRRGPAVLVFNHSCYIDAVFCGIVTRRPVHHLTTAEAYRGGVKGWLVTHFVNVPVRRYRQDPAACREMLRLLAEGEVIGIAIEGERAALGRYQGALADVAGIMARLGVPIIPVGISGAYDVGPRWSDVVRRRRVRVRAGPPVEFDAASPAAAIDRAILALLDENPQRVFLEGLPREKLGRVLWRCPACLREEEWHAARLACEACGVRYEERHGWLVDAAGRAASLAELGERVRSVADERAIVLRAGVWRERSMFGPIEPLERLGEGAVSVGPDGVRFKGLHIPIRRITSVGTERADTLQVATRDGMWQLRLLEGSAFRLHLAVVRWRRTAERPAAAGRRQAV
ncbi:MAG: 1-acyl-sn-glycerol-3-phosphate acyltransferase [Gemmatimonadota bacterium]|nr:MAG: 1-acyl-sn-glycerol-3-phosphate acyltransferase [Gemmatimonadota bacterium]